jgi:hypothetical protein
MWFDALQLSWVALGDPDPLELCQPNSFPCVGSHASKHSTKLHELFPEAFWREMASGALQLSLVALGDRDPLEWRQSDFRLLCARCCSQAIARLNQVLSSGFSPLAPSPASRKKILAVLCSRGSSQVRVTHEFGRNKVYMHIGYG